MCQLNGLTSHAAIDCNSKHELDNNFKHWTKVLCELQAVDIDRNEMGEDD